MNYVPEEHAVRVAASKGGEIGIALAARLRLVDRGLVLRSFDL